MRFVIHGDLTPAVADAIRRHGHAVEELPPISEPDELLHQCHVKQLDILSNDAKFVQAALENPVRFDRCIVFLQLAGEDVEQDDAVDRLFARYKRLTPRKLYTVTETRVKVRQLPVGA